MNTPPATARAGRELEQTQPAATCFTCWREALPAEDQTPRSDSGTKKGHNPDRVIRMRCNAGHEFTTPLAAALEHGAFLDRARLRNYTPPAPIQMVQTAVSEALTDAVSAVLCKHADCTDPPRTLYGIYARLCYRHQVEARMRRRAISPSPRRGSRKGGRTFSTVVDA